MTVHLIRHTRPNVEKGVCYGQSDLGLAATFQSELPTVKKNMANIGFDAVYSSPLQRCAQLARQLCPLGMEVVYDDRLKELDFGEWELKIWDEVSKSPAAVGWFADFVHVACPGGESYLDLFGRVMDFIAQTKKKKDCEQPLIVSHMGVIRAFYSISGGIELEKSFDFKIGFGEQISLEL